MLRIILIEDNQEHSRIIEKVIREASPSCKIHYFESAEKAMENIHILNYDDICVVFIDMLLPGMSGIEFTKKLRDAKNFVPITVLTGFYSDQEINDAARVGVNSYLVKPCSLSKFREMMKCAVEYWGTWNMR